jgi:hypothetical protein
MDRAAPRHDLFLWTSIVLVLLTLAAAMALRYRVIEPSAVGLVCDPGTGPWWCGARAAVIVLFGSGLIGLASVVTGVLAHVLDRRWLATVALVAGSAGLVLYNADMAAAGFVVGLLRAVRR